MNILFRPFRAIGLWGDETQGVALGYLILAFQAAELEELRKALRE